jgi:hypothetical protein
MRDMDLAFEDVIHDNRAPGLIGDETFDVARVTLGLVRTRHQIPRR